jgi:hypothetical protein
LNHASKSPAPHESAFDWQKCVSAFTDTDARKLADWRGLSLEFVRWLHGQKLVALHAGNVAFPVHKQRAVVSCHYRLLDGTWKYFPQGQGTQPLIFGNVQQAAYVSCFESQPDAFAWMDICGWHTAAPVDTAVSVTRGADTEPTPQGLNARHPDFAAFAVRIGRAVGREAEVIAALKAAEADKSAFCLENDAIGAALVAYLHGAQPFSGTAAELAPKLIETDKDLDGKLSSKRLGKRLSALWPHLTKSLAECRKETDRTGLLHFTFRSNAEFADFQTDFSQNP